VLAVLWIWWIGSLLAVIFGHIALSQIKRSQGWTTGRGMAIAGVVLGWVGLASLVILLLVASVVGDGDSVDTSDPVDVSDPVENDASVLDGEYRYDWTVDELVAAGVPEDTVRQYAMAGVYTWNLEDGDLVFTSEFPDGNTVVCAGTYQVTGDDVSLSLRSPCPLYTFTATWALTDDHIAMFDTLLDGQALPAVEVWLGQKPWTRID
jgi:hypothetical protein